MSENKTPEENKDKSSEPKEQDKKPTRAEKLTKRKSKPISKK